MILQNDINTKGYTQWFYFSMRNTKPRQIVNLTIVNMVNKSDFISKKNFTIILFYTRRKINHNSKMDCFLLCFPFNNLKKMAQNGIVQDQILFLEKAKIFK